MLPTGRRRIALVALVLVVLVLTLAGSHPKTQNTVLQWAPAKRLRSCQQDPAACVRIHMDATDEAEELEWDPKEPPAAVNASAPACAKELKQMQQEQQDDSMVLNQLASGFVGRLPTYASRSSVLAQRDLLQRLFAHEMGFPEARVRRAVSYAGNAERLHRVLHKLIRGDAITVAAVGGSVTAGVGADTQDLSYRERLFHWIRTTFPNNNHTFVNGALAAAPSSYMSQCIRDYAPAHSDLVFVEFTMNDGQKTCDVKTDGRRGFEVLLRKLLSYPHRPAVVILHWWSPTTQDFWVSPEDQLDVFSKFYGLPSLSWRDAVHDLLASNATGFTHQDIYFDRAHPNGYNGHRYFSDIIVGFLRNEAASLILSGLDVSAEPIAAKDMPELPEPMHEGNYEGKSDCMRGEAFKQAVIDAQGWDWVDEGKNGQQKWGYVSWHDGDQLKIKANTETYRGRSMVLVGVGILKSYEHMGIAELSCVSGCECGTATLDGHWDSKTSQSEWVYHSVGQHPECVLSIRNTNRSSSGEHKVLVNSFLVTNLHNSSIKWFSHIDELKDKYAEEGLGWTG